MISKEINAVKQNANKQTQNVFSVTYSKLKAAGNNAQIIPNPPKEILNQIVLTMQSQYWETAQTSSVTAKAASGAEKSNLVLSKLLSKFSRFVPFIKTQIQKSQIN